MTDKPIREQSALELLETHAKALEGYCMENARLRAVLAKAANRLGAHDSICASYSTSDDDLVEHFEPKGCDCYLKGSAVETTVCQHEWVEAIAAPGFARCKRCGEKREAYVAGRAEVVATTCKHHNIEVGTSSLRKWCENCGAEVETDSPRICHWRDCRTIMAPGDAYLCLEHRMLMNRPTDCSGDPKSCPDNEGTGCYCSRSGLA